MLDEPENQSSLTRAANKTRISNRSSYNRNRNTVLMKKRNLLLTCMILSALIPVNSWSEQTAVIKIDLDRTIAKVDPNIYGAFVEPIRTVVYGSIYDPISPLADTNGFRKDFVQLVRDLHIPVVRWPGGNYVSGYNWEDGIGPKNLRPARLDLAWNQIDHNQMGTDEYAKLCSMIGSDNFVCINAGLGTLDQANRSETNAIASDIVLQSGEFTENALLKEVNGESVTATNAKTQQGVAIATKEIQFSGNNIKCSFPAHSFTQMLIPIK